MNRLNMVNRNVLEMEDEHSPRHALRRLRDVPPKNASCMGVPTQPFGGGEGSCYNRYVVEQ